MSFQYTVSLTALPRGVGVCHFRTSQRFEAFRAATLSCSLPAWHATPRSPAAASNRLTSLTVPLHALLGQRRTVTQLVQAV